MSKKSRTADTPEFEKSLAELEQIVERWTRRVSLDESLKQFERGIALTRHCQTALQQAEQKVEILMRKNGNEMTAEAVPFDTDDDEAEVTQAFADCLRRWKADTETALDRLLPLDQAVPTDCTKPCAIACSGAANACARH